MAASGAALTGGAGGAPGGPLRQALSRVPWPLVFQHLSLRERFALARCSKFLRQAVYAMPSVDFSHESRITPPIMR